MLIGYLKKVVIADTLAQFVDKAYKDISSYTGFSLILVILFFTIQIYCDFSGYSDIAIGSAKLMGIDLMTNFKSPYFSRNIKEFWSRWHISLSTWFKDYVYIPLGGNRVSKVRHKVNLLITFLVSGLWHGADWTFVLWGAAHGIAQIFTVKPGKNSDNSTLSNIIKIAVTFAFCNLAWVLFRAQTISDALYVYTHMHKGIKTGLMEYIKFGFSTLGCDKTTCIKILISVLIVAIIDVAALNDDPFETLSGKPVYVRWGIYIAISLIIIFFMPVVKDTQFIYFQF